MTEYEIYLKMVTRCHGDRVSKSAITGTTDHPTATHEIVVENGYSGFEVMAWFNSAGELLEIGAWE